MKPCAHWRVTKKAACWHEYLGLDQQQGFEVVGGTLANSRQFMEQILMPLQVDGNLPVNGALSRGLSPVSAPQLNSYNGFTEQLNGEWTFRL